MSNSFKNLLAIVATREFYRLSDSFFGPSLMRLSVHTDYALRLLMYLALKKDRLATVAEIAEIYDISRNHLTKVAHDLGLAGYIVGVRGRGRRY